MKSTHIMTKYRRIWMALGYLVLAGIPAYQTIRHADREAQYLKKAYDTNNLENNGAVKEAEVWKDITSQHHFLGPIIKGFVAPTINRQFHIPSQKDAQAALDGVYDFYLSKRNEAAAARLWSLFLLMLSLTYFAITLSTKNETRSDHLFALAVISVIFLSVGVLAPAMVLIVSPNVTGFPHFILDYQIRSIFGVISELYASSYWMVAVCLTVFSILIPLTKAGLTIFVLESKSLPRKLRIAKFLHSISKWSMADVLVAAILLSNFAVKSNENTQANLFLGFYYFLSYCLLSLVTTTLLQNKIEKLHPKVEPPVTKKARVPHSRITDKNKGL